MITIYISMYYIYINISSLDISSFDRSLQTVLLSRASYFVNYLEKD